jgi:two-component system sensor histidine kinase BarA
MTDARWREWIRALPFHYYLVIVILVAVIPLITFVTLVDYSVSEKELSNSMNLLMENTEESVMRSVCFVDNSLEIYDMSLNAQLREGFIPFIACYETSGGDPSQMDLEGLKADLLSDMDLYIINSTGVIEYSTCETEIGLDFSEYPDFFTTITALREGDDFAADRIVKEITTGEERKYAYMPTPDHRYLLELGLTSDTIQEYHDKKYFREIREELKDLNPYLTEIRFFDSMGDPISGSDTPNSPEFKAFLLEKVIAPRTNVEVTDEENKILTRYIMIDLLDERYASDRSVIAELNYSTALITEQLNQLLFIHLLIGIFAILLSVGGAYAASRYLTRPIRDIVEDVDTIASGGLDHSIREPQGKEFQVLERSTNMMVAHLKENIARLKESEEQIRDHSENLETRVSLRTQELKEANEKANLYLDIMTHDINNANLTTLASLELLMPQISESARYRADMGIKSVRKSIEIIHNVSTIRRIHESTTPLFTVDLNQVIESEMRTFPDLKINYAGTDAQVLADGLLPEVFTNLLGNSAKFMDPDGEVTIRLEEIGEREILVSLEDTGPGISPSEKEEIFNRFKIGMSSRSGKGLGLYIARALVERYGGTIWAEDRIRDRPECGAAIRFTLIKSPLY